MLFLLWVMPHCSSFCSEDIVKWAWVVLTEIDAWIYIYFLRETGSHIFSSEQADFALTDFVAPFLCFLQTSVWALLFTTVTKLEKSISEKIERKNHDTLWKHLLSYFGSSLWVLECFNHSVKTMSCNLAVQRPFTQPTQYSGAGIHSADLDHQRST